ncbi:heme NO-binding domain-containing protein [Leptolyngbya sp. NK1-12]|uniref:Heme NO-binding domain-containing protein n=1 Tax=Leptolyngbya sp. NK1-12 TaxID=2547451 RepID=A0AA96WC64_9CYAN|nr:heme NO-binding domain-containing protein [Leptolyngbya sp. NK1-12]MBF2045895.1 heme NO-binding domain-containing protein [Elainella sp. C42_A2020_010]WNZ22240.1 heme NO-binding domain-containing protein [Leptolyngbya sp. NK1-12]
MYGLVNKALKDMVCTRFGEESWQMVQQQAEIDIETFVNVESYPDDLTHRLVKAASQVLNLSSSEIMQAFGEYWVQYTASEGFAEIIDMCGDNLPEFLENLDNLHARVGVVFPKLQPPSFECTDVKEETLNLHYYSHRQGLTPMVFGLIQGLGKRFNTKVNVTQTKSREEGNDHDEFSVRYRQN